MTETVPRPRMQLRCLVCKAKEWRRLEECATGDEAPRSSCCDAPTMPTAVEA